MVHKMDNTTEKKDPLAELLRSTMDKVHAMADTNTIVGQPITTPDGVTILPVSKVSVGFGGGGSDFANNKPGDPPFGGGVGGGVKVTPLCFLVIKDGNVRMMSVPEPANSTADRLVEMMPDTLEKLTDYLNAKKGNQE